MHPTRSPGFRTLAIAFVPEAARLSEDDWADLVRIVDGALAERPEKMRRQLGILIAALGVLPVFRYGKTLAALDAERRARFLHAIETAPALLLRRGFWGLRTLVFMGYYGRQAAKAEIGYRAHLRGWEGRPERPTSALPRRGAPAEAAR